MHADTAEIDAPIAADAQPKPGGKARLLRLEDLDRRTGTYRKVAETIGQVEADLGGSSELSTAERQIVRHAVLSGAMADDLGARWLSGEPVDPGMFSALCNGERRLYEAVGIRRRPRDTTQTVEEYLAGRAEEPVAALVKSGGTE